MSGQWDRLKRSQKLNSLGWTPEGRRLIHEARAKGVCVSCGRRSKSKLPLGDSRRRIACRSECANLFYEQHYQSWATTKRAVLRRVRVRFGGQIRCEQCGRKPVEVEKRKKVAWDMGNGRQFISMRTWSHPGYEFDHIIPLALNGAAQDPANVELLCLRCHRRKTARQARAIRHSVSELKPNAGSARLEQFVERKK